MTRALRFLVTGGLAVLGGATAQGTGHAGPAPVSPWSQQAAAADFALQGWTGPNLVGLGTGAIYGRVVDSGDNHLCYKLQSFQWRSRVGSGCCVALCAANTLIAVEGEKRICEGEIQINSVTPFNNFVVQCGSYEMLNCQRFDPNKRGLPPPQGQPNAKVEERRCANEVGPAASAPKGSPQPAAANSSPKTPSPASGNNQVAVPAKPPPQPAPEVAAADNAPASGPARSSPDVALDDGLPKPTDYTSARRTDLCTSNNLCVGTVYFDRQRSRPYMTGCGIRRKATDYTVWLPSAFREPGWEKKYCGGKILIEPVRGRSRAEPMEAWIAGVAGTVRLHPKPVSWNSRAR